MSTEKTTKRYIEAIGRRKTASARVRITEADKETFVVNDKAIHEYFDTPSLVNTAHAALTHAGLTQKFSVSVKVLGGGIAGQADAVSHGLARALVIWDEELKKQLKKEGLLKRDSRKKERKKFGLKKARKAPTWSKR
jgi:small subunit ribosomal protein S9